MKTKQPLQPDLKKSVAGTSARKAYVAPRLIEYGSVAKLTASGTGSTSDGLMSMMGCL